MLLGNHRAVSGSGFRILVGATDEIGGDRPTVVEIVFAILQRIVLQKAPQCDFFAGLLGRGDPPSEQFVICLVVIREWFDWPTVSGGGP